MGARVYIPALGRFLGVDSVEGGTDNNYVYANDPVNQFDLDGKFIPFVLGAVYVANVAYSAYQAKKSPSPLNTVMLAASLAPGGVVAGSAMKGFKIANLAKRGVGNYDLGTAGKMTGAFAKKFFVAGSKSSVRSVRGPHVKQKGIRSGQNVMNFERFRVAPTTKKLKQAPNRVGNGHLRIKGWW